MSISRAFLALTLFPVLGAGILQYPIEGSCPTLGAMLQPESGRYRVYIESIRSGRCWRVTPLRSTPSGSAGGVSQTKRIVGTRFDTDCCNRREVARRSTQSLPMQPPCRGVKMLQMGPSEVSRGRRRAHTTESRLKENKRDSC